IFALSGLASLQATAVDESQAITTPAYGEVVLVHSPPEIMTLQKLPNFVGVSGHTVGAKQLSMNLVVIPPGGRARPHHHQGFESAVYVLEGRVETRWGPKLEHSIITEAGDFLFIPPDVPHQPINLSDVEPARAIVVRNDPREQEHVVTYDPAVDEAKQ
ncbi:MAG: cupin domain-containing protein, partial [Chromatiales bacterium]